MVADDDPPCNPGKAVIGGSHLGIFRSGGCGLLLFHCRPEKLVGKFSSCETKATRFGADFGHLSRTFDYSTAPDLAFARAPKRWEMVFVTCDDHSKQASRRLVPYDGVILDVVVTGSDGATCAFLEHDVRLLAYPVLPVWLLACTRYLLSPWGGIPSV